MTPSRLSNTTRDVLAQSLAGGPDQHHHSWPPPLPLRIVNRRRTAFVAIASMGMTTLSLSAVAPRQSNAQETAAWLRTVNAYRANAGLPPVTENGSWTQGLTEHSGYVLETGVPGHTQNAGAKGASAAGALAAKGAVVNAWSPSFPRTDEQVIDEWARAPFHGLHFFEPRWQQSAFGSAREAGRLPVEGAAALDVLRGYGPVVRANRPITFPGDATSVPVSSFTAESPDPLTACPGYAAPTGLPLLVLYPEPVNNAVAEVKANGTVVASCLIDRNYVNPDATAQTVGRKLMNQKNALVIIPQAPLQTGVSYEVLVTSSASPLRWTFTVDPSKGPTPTANQILVGAAPSLQPQAAAKPTQATGPKKTANKKPTNAPTKSKTKK
jgi:uncharacterized protein YkwD